MTYNVFSGTLNPTQSINHYWFQLYYFAFLFIENCRYTCFTWAEVVTTKNVTYLCILLIISRDLLHRN